MIKTSVIFFTSNVNISCGTLKIGVGCKESISKLTFNGNGNPWYKGCLLITLTFAILFLISLKVLIWPFLSFASPCYNAIPIDMKKDTFSNAKQGGLIRHRGRHNLHRPWRKRGKCWKINILANGAIELKSSIAHCGHIVSMNYCYIWHICIKIKNYMNTNIINCWTKWKQIWWAW